MPLAAGVRLGVPGVSPELHHALLELLDRHVPRPEVEIEQGAAVPGAGIEEPTFGGEAVIEPGARKRGEEGDLDLQQARALDELPQLIENGGGVGVQADD